MSRSNNSLYFSFVKERALEVCTSAGVRGGAVVMLHPPFRRDLGDVILNFTLRAEGTARVVLCDHPSIFMIGSHWTEIGMIISKLWELVC